MLHVHGFNDHLFAKAEMMRCKIVIMAMLAAAMSLPGDAHAQAARPGETWRAMGRPLRRLIASWYLEGWRASAVEFIGEQLEDVSALDSVHSGEWPLDAVLDAMDHLYLDRRNIDLRISTTLKYALAAVGETPAAAVECRLAFERALHSDVEYVEVADTLLQQRIVAVGRCPPLNFPR